MSILQQALDLPIEIKAILTFAVLFQASVFGVWFFMLRKEVVRANKEKND